MNQLPESGLPEAQANPFAAPSVAAAESVHLMAAEMLQPLAQYSSVRRGLQLIYYSIATVASLIVVSMLIGFAASASGVSPAPFWFGSVLMFFGVAIIIAMLVMVVGFCMTIACPRPDEKPRAILSVVCFFLGFGISMVGNIVVMRTMSAPVASLVMSLVTNILYVASSVLFCLLLKRIGRNVSSNRLEQSARSLLMWYGILFVVVLVGGSLVSFVSFNSIRASGAGGVSSSVAPLIGILGGLGMLAISLVVLFKYLAMLRAGINALDAKRHA